MEPQWNIFVARYAQTVLDAALRVLARNADAEDVAQEVFLEVLRSGRCAELLDQPALVRTMATRRALDRLRRRRTHESLAERDWSGGEPEPVEYALANELDQRLRDELAKLAPREAEVFCLTYFAGLGASDVARSLGITSGAAAKFLSTARRRLSDALQIKRSDSKS